MESGPERFAYNSGGKLSWLATGTGFRLAVSGGLGVSRPAHPRPRRP